MADENEEGTEWLDDPSLTKEDILARFNKLNFEPTVGPRTEAEVERAFKRLKAQWLYETSYLSSLTLMVNNPAYQAIISLGDRVLPFILADLDHEPNHWFVALATITGVDPGKGETTVEGARQKWLDWWKIKQYLSA